VGIAFFTGCVICWQSWETRKAANGAVEAGKAALVQIQMVKDKERARLRVEMQPLDFVPLEMFGANVYPVRFKLCLEGVTQAYILEQRAFAGICPADSFPETPPFTFPLNLPSVIVPRKKPLKSFAFLASAKKDSQIITIEAQDIERIKNCKSAVYFIGSILYRDVFGGRWRVNFKQKWRSQKLPEDLAELQGGWESYGSEKENGEKQAKWYPDQKPLCCSNLLARFITKFAFAPGSRDRYQCRPRCHLVRSKNLPEMHP
jgi:hypothetical protein